MTASALVMGALGLAATFLPQEIAAYLGASTTLPLLIQILGALYLGFAMLNWMARTSLIGGIYSRPVASGNLVHFVVGALALAKAHSPIYPDYSALRLGSRFSRSRSDDFLRAL